MLDAVTYTIIIRNIKNLVMDLSEKVEELVNITTDLHKEIQELKVKDYNTLIDELEQENEALKDDILDFRHNLTQQNEMILSLINQNNKLVGVEEADKLQPQLLCSRDIPDISKAFPIKSLKELDELENIISEENIDELTAMARQLLQPKGIIKNISLVMSVPCIMECNVEGRHYKRRLLNSPKFMDLVFRAAYDGSCNRETFLDEFRHGFQKVKNRHNKNLCRHRQRQREMERESMQMLPEKSIEKEETQ